MTGACESKLSLEIYRIYSLKWETTKIHHDTTTGHKKQIIQFINCHQIRINQVTVEQIFYLVCWKGHKEVLCCIRILKTNLKRKHIRLIKHHVMKTDGVAEIQLHQSWPRQRIEVSAQCHTPAALPCRHPRAWSWPLTSIQCRGDEWWNYTSTPPHAFMAQCLITQLSTGTTLRLPTGQEAGRVPDPV
jgi:hypothetical protein